MPHEKARQRNSRSFQSWSSCQSIRFWTSASRVAQAGRSMGTADSWARWSFTRLKSSPDFPPKYLWIRPSAHPARAAISRVVVASYPKRANKVVAAQMRASCLAERLFDCLIIRQIGGHSRGAGICREQTRDAAGGFLVILLDATVLHIRNMKSDLNSFLLAGQAWLQVSVAYHLQLAATMPRPWQFGQEDRRVSPERIAVFRRETVRDWRPR